LSVQIIENRLATYFPKSIQETEFALKEITQELVLMALSNHGFFKKAAFQGGTCLRILHQLPRFSEDLDFALIEPDETFDLRSFFSSLEQELAAYGYNIQVTDRPSNPDSAMRQAFIKDDSLVRIVDLQYKKTDGPSKSLKIKIEVDTNPPADASFALGFHDFPIHFSIRTHDLPTLFAGKSHALLARPFLKGRDWFDFLWYRAQKVTPNYKFLSAAIDQTGPWKGQKIEVDQSWYRREMAAKIESIRDWDKVKKDVQRFLKPGDLKTLDLWSTAFFHSQLLKG
jgi:hypothetical protein